jgi:hypothetical protein
MIFAGPALADTLILKDGREVDGEVTIEGDSYVVRTPAGITVRFPRDRVLSVRKTASARASYDRDRAELESGPESQSAEAWFELGRSAAKKGLHDDARAAYLRAVQLEEDHPEARRALGHVFVDGLWLEKSALEEEEPPAEEPARRVDATSSSYTASGSGMRAKEYITCPKCSGTRYEFWLPCTQCTKSRRPGYLDTGQYMLPCNRCGTKTKLPGVKCRTCQGYGKVTQERLDNLDKPRRVRQGYELCFTCGGTGVETWLPCSQCTKSAYPGFLNMGEYMLPCNRCGTKGRLPGIQCQQCGGYGVVREK